MDDKHFEIEDFGMSEAIERLREAGIRFQQPTPYQLKVGLLNFYPSTGRITLDGGGGKKGQDIDDFIDRARKAGFGLRPSK